MLFVVVLLLRSVALLLFSRIRFRKFRFRFFRFAILSSMAKRTVFGDCSIGWLLVWYSSSSLSSSVDGRSIEWLEARTISCGTLVGLEAIVSLESVVEANCWRNAASILAVLSMIFVWNSFPGQSMGQMGSKQEKMKHPVVEFFAQKLVRMQSCVGETRNISFSETQIPIRCALRGCRAPETRNSNITRTMLVSQCCSHNKHWIGLAVLRIHYYLLYYNIICTFCFDHSPHYSPTTFS